MQNLSQFCVNRLDADKPKKAGEKMSGLVRWKTTLNQNTSKDAEFL